MSSSDQTSTRDRIFFLVSSAALFFAVILGIAREQRWGTRFLTYHLLIKDVNGLNSGQDIRLSGVPIGHVGSLKLQNDANVRVELKIDPSKAALVGQNSKVSLNLEGLLGYRFLEISADPGDSHLPDGSRLSYEPQASVQDLITQVHRTLENTTQLTASQGQINQTLIELRATLRNADELSKELNREVQATSPVVRQSLSNLTEETLRTEEEAMKLLLEARPLIVDTLNEVRDVMHTSNSLLRQVRDVIGPWLEPAR